MRYIKHKGKFYMSLNEYTHIENEMENSVIYIKY